jgi:hypothetical protein
MERFIWYFNFGNAKKSYYYGNKKTSFLLYKKEVIDCDQFIVLACFNWF